MKYQISLIITIFLIPLVFLSFSSNPAYALSERTVIVQAEDNEPYSHSKRAEEKHDSKSEEDYMKKEETESENTEESTKSEEDQYEYYYDSNEYDQYHVPDNTEVESEFIWSDEDSGAEDNSEYITPEEDSN